MTGVALVLLVFQKLPLLVARASLLAGAALVPCTSQAIEIGVAKQFKPDTVYMSFFYCTQPPHAEVTAGNGAS